MGKRDHGRLVHQVRDALINGGFEPPRITQLDSPEGSSAGRVPGFKVDKHNDGRSVRLSYAAGRPPSGEEMNWQERQTLGAALMKKLVGYHAVLERAGFVCVALDSRDPVAPFSLWRRANNA